MSEQTTVLVDSEWAARIEKEGDTIYAVNEWAEERNLDDARVPLTPEQLEAAAEQAADLSEAPRFGNRLLMEFDSGVEVLWDGSQMGFDTGAGGTWLSPEEVIAAAEKA